MNTPHTRVRQTRVPKPRIRLSFNFPSEPSAVRFFLLRRKGVGVEKECLQGSKIKMEAGSIKDGAITLQNLCFKQGSPFHEWIHSFTARSLSLETVRASVPVGHLFVCTYSIWKLNQEFSMHLCYACHKDLGKNNTGSPRTRKKSVYANRPGWVW